MTPLLVLLMCLAIGVCSGQSDCETIPAIPTSSPTLTRSLCSELRDLRDLIPSQTLTSLIRRHYRYDARFRHAMRFLHTAQFAEAVAEIECSAEYRNALLSFQRAGVDIANIANVFDILDCLMVPIAGNETCIEDYDYDYGEITIYGNESANCSRVPKAAISEQSSAALALIRNHTRITRIDEVLEVILASNSSDFKGLGGLMMASPRSVQTLVDQLIHAIPRKQFRALITRKRAANPQFARFYAILRSSAFRRQVRNALASQGLAGPLSVLRRNYIDVRYLFNALMRVFSWGPKV